MSERSEISFEFENQNLIKTNVIECFYLLSCITDENEKIKAYYWTVSKFKSNEIISECLHLLL